MEPTARVFWRMYAVVAIVIIIAVSVGAALSIHTQRRLLAERERERAVTAVEIVAATLQRQVANGDVGAMHAVFRETMHERPEITSAFIAEGTGKILVHSDAAREGQRVFDLIPAPAGMIMRALAAAPDAPVLEVTLPLRVGEHRDGSLRAQVRLQRAVPDVVSSSLPFAVAGILLLTVAGVATGVLSRNAVERAHVTRYPRIGARYGSSLEPVRATESAGLLDNDVTLRARADASLNAARDAAVEAARAKTAFLANMTREMRAPLHEILADARALAAETSGTPRQLAEHVLATGEGLLTLNRKIADYLRVEGGALQGDEDIDPYLLVADVVESFAPLAAKKGIELAWWIDPDVPTALHGKGQQLREVLAKLIANAVRFTDSGEVCVAASCQGDRDAAALLRFTVRDTGCGIDPQQRPRLFTLAPNGSSGLGLLLCKQLVDSMQGTIGTDDNTDRGSTFWLTVPLLPQPRTVTALPHDEGLLRSQRILIVDDNATSRSILERQLESWMIPHEAVSGAREALIRLRAAVDYGAPYALAIVDSLMPETNGFDLARAIRQEPKLAALPLLLLTPAGVSCSEQLGDVRVDATLTKPVRPSRLYTCLAAVLLANMKGAEEQRLQGE